MRISPVTSAYGHNSAPQKQVNFGYFADKPKTNEPKDQFLKRTKDEREKILEILPSLNEYTPCGDYDRSKYKDMDTAAIQTLAEHPAVIIKRNGSKVYGVLNKDYAGTKFYKDFSEDGSCYERIGSLNDTQDFLSFWQHFYYLTTCEEDAKHPPEPPREPTPEEIAEERRKQRELERIQRQEEKERDRAEALDYAWNVYKW